MLSARSANVIHAFCPFRTYSSPSFSARVATLSVFVPASGSVMPIEKRRSPVATSVRYVSFCRSVPCFFRPTAAMPAVNTRYQVPAIPQPSAHSVSMTSPISCMPIPAPSYSVGTSRPWKPASASSSQNARENSPFASISRQYSGPNSSAMSVAVDRIIECSALVSKCMLSVLVLDGTRSPLVVFPAGRRGFRSDPYRSLTPRGTAQRLRQGLTRRHYRRGPAARNPG